MKWRFIIVGLGSWLALNVIVVVLLYLNAQRVIDDFINTDIPKRLEITRGLLYTLRFTSLGLVYLRPLGTVYDTASEAANSLHAGYELKQALTPLLLNSLGGKPVPYETYAQAFTPLQTLRKHMQRLIDLTNSPDIMTLTSITKTHDRFIMLRGELRRLMEILEKLNDPNNRWASVVGYDQPRHYIVLMQNNMELRPTGGFLGSYAEFWLDKGAMTNLNIQDIYVPDGQIKGYVKEPDPIRDHLFSGGTPGWRLRDSNWEPDFTKATPQIAWFFEEGGVKPIDGMIGINLFLIQAILARLGTLEMPDYNLTVTHDTFYRQTQYAAEHDFFPGSTQKGDFLAATGKALLKKIMSGGNQELQALLPAFYANLETKHILVSLIKFPENRFFKDLDWDGGIKPIPFESGYLNDYLYINEANLGINKTNCCVDRSLQHTITVTDNSTLTHDLVITYKNNNPPMPKPPVNWGGGYKNYVRIFLPVSAKLTSVKINNTKVEEITKTSFEDKQEIGFLVRTEGGVTDVVRMSYTLLIPENPPPDTYALMMQKQSGIDGWPVDLTFIQGDKRLTSSTFLTKDGIFSFPMVY